MATQMLHPSMAPRCPQSSPAQGVADTTVAIPVPGTAPLILTAEVVRSIPGCTLVLICMPA